VGSTQAAPNEAAAFSPVQAQIAGNASNAAALSAQTPPQTYQPNTTNLNSTAALLAQAQTLQNNQALAQVNPQALAGKTQAITDLTGGVAGDNAFLQNAALKSGLEAGANQGTVGPGSIVTPTSAGGVTADKIFGSQLLNYRNMRDQQALGVAGAIQPDAALSPSMGVGLQLQAGQQQVQNQNDWNQYLSNIRLGQVNNLQNEVQQSEGLTQANANANANAANANRSQNTALETGAGVALTTAAIGAAVL
jgi:hypothetical protein